MATESSIQAPDWLAMVTRSGPARVACLSSGAVVLSTRRTRPWLNALQAVRRSAVFDPFFRWWRIEFGSPDSAERWLEGLEGFEVEDLPRYELETAAAVMTLSDRQGFTFHYDCYRVRGVNPNGFQRRLEPLLPLYGDHPHLEWQQDGLDLWCRRYDVHRSFRAALIRAGLPYRSPCLEAAELLETVEHGATI